MHYGFNNGALKLISNYFQGQQNKIKIKTIKFDKKNKSNTTFTFTTVQNLNSCFKLFKFKTDIIYFKICSAKNMKKML